MHWLERAGREARVQLLTNGPEYDLNAFTMALKRSSQEERAEAVMNLEARISKILAPDIDRINE